MLNLMYITNNPRVGLIAEGAGIDRIWIDLEFIGKAERQCGLDTVQSRHSIDDIEPMKNVLTKSKLLVRTNQIYEGTEWEIDRVIEAGADYIMLPYFKSIEQVKIFLDCVRGRTKTVLLFETPQSIALADKILDLPGIDEAYIGLNDLHLEKHQKFIFTPLADGTVDKAAGIFKKHNIPFGFGGVEKIGRGTLPADVILEEHKRLGSSSVILSRNFCNKKITDYNDIRLLFNVEVGRIRRLEKLFESFSEEDFMMNNQNMKSIVRLIEDYEEE